MTVGVAVGYLMREFQILCLEKAVAFNHPHLCPSVLSCGAVGEGKVHH